MDSRKPAGTRSVIRYVMLIAGAAAVIVMCGMIIRICLKPDDIHRHKYVRTVIKDVTCSQDGEAEYICSECGNRYTAPIPARGHRLTDVYDTSGKMVQGECVTCGKKINFLRYGDTGVSFTAPVRTRGDRAAVTVVNSQGVTYEYVIYNQKAEYDSYSRYINLHGCSTCALTTLLRATVLELEDYTPDQVISEIEPEVMGSRAFNANYSSDGNNGKMPLTLYGMTKIFDKYGVGYKLADADPANYVKEITEHLKNGDPVVITLGSGKSIGVSRSIHTILLLGLDSDGNVIVGDSVKKSAKKFGDDGLIKQGKFTVSQVVDCILDFGNWAVSEGSYGNTGNWFYHKKADRGYLLVYKR